MPTQVIGVTNRNICGFFYTTNKKGDEKMKKIELKHISILPLQTKLKIQKTQIQNQNALIENSWIDDYQKLKDLYERQEKYKWDIFTDDIYFEIEKRKVKT